MTDESRDDVVIAAKLATHRQVTASPFGADDQIGMMNILTDATRGELLSRVTNGALYDLAVEFFVEMPGYYGANDPHFEICMSHTPPGTRNEGGAQFGGDVAGYSGDIVSFYTHCGTHLDSLNHFGYGDQVWNGFSAATDLGSRHWLKNGPEHLPPVVTRGVLLDVAGALGTDVLPDSYGVGPAEIEKTLGAQGVALEPGDAVLMRTGKMGLWPDQESFASGYRFPGLNLEAARVLAEAGCVIVGTDAMSPEQSPSAISDHPAPVHSYLLSECGVLIIENLWLEDLARDRVYEFGFFGAPIKFRGATGTPIRPFATRLG